MRMEKTGFRICILGGGPGGIAAALTLSQSGIPCLVLEKNSFPRDKICGDAISAKALTILGRIDPGILERLNNSGSQQTIKRALLVSPNGSRVDIRFGETSGHPPGYIIKRWDFDHFLVKEALKHPLIELKEGVEARTFEKHDQGYRILDQTGQLIADTPLIIDASGAYSKFSRTEGGLLARDRHYGIAIRAYVSQVNWGNNPDALEFYLLKDIVPGYLWIFPLPDGKANIGIGLRKDWYKKRKINLESTLIQLLRTHPLLAARFKKAQIEGKILGYGLPLGSSAQPISGDHCLLVGDAGHLIDPLTGEGIGNAIYSGYLAAQTAARALETNNFSAGFLAGYDRNVARILGSEMRITYRLQQLMRFPLMVNLLVKLINRQKVIQDLLAQLPTDIDIRQFIGKPGFWIKNIFLKK